MSSPTGRFFSALPLRQPSPSYAACRVKEKRICRRGGRGQVGRGGELSKHAKSDLCELGLDAPNELQPLVDLWGGSTRCWAPRRPFAGRLYLWGKRLAFLTLATWTISRCHAAFQCVLAVEWLTFTERPRFALAGLNVHRRQGTRKWEVGFFYSFLIRSTPFFFRSHAYKPYLHASPEKLGVTWYACDFIRVQHLIDALGTRAPIAVR